MKYFIVLTAFLVNGLLLQSITYSQEGQNDSANINLFYLYSSPLVYDTAAVIKFSFAGHEERLFLTDSLLYFDNYDSLKSFLARKDSDGPWNPEKMNFYDSAFILVAYHGVDCHSAFDIKLIDDPVLQKYVFTVKVIYGGCRAGGRRFVHWIKIPKLPDGYSIGYRWYYDK
jgi:hypothetical protein